MDRNEARHTLAEAKARRSSAIRDRDRLVKEAGGIDMNLEPAKYEELNVKILAFDELIKSLDAKIENAQKRLDR